MKVCKDKKLIEFYYSHPRIKPFIFGEGDCIELNEDHFTQLTKAPFYCFEVNNGMISINPYRDGCEGHMLMLEKGKNAVDEARKVMYFLKKNNLCEKLYARCYTKEMALFLNILKFQKINTHLYMRVL